MYLHEVKLGTQVAIEVDRNGVMYNFKSKVEDKHDNGILVTHLSQGYLAFEPNKDDVVTVSVTIEGKALSWNCFEWGKEIVDGFNLVRLSSLEAGKSINRRNAFRVSIDGGLSLFNFLNGDTFLGYLSNLSFTGVAFKTVKRLNIGDVVAFTHRDKNYGVELYLMVNIVRIGERTASDEMYFYGAKLLNTGENVSKYVMLKQREEIKKLRSS